MVNVIKEKNNLLVLCLKEELHENKSAESVVMAVQDEQDEGWRLSDEIEEVIRLWKYIKGKTHPMEIRLKSQASAVEGTPTFRIWNPENSEKSNF